MRKRKPSLRLSLLSCAIAVAATGASRGAYAVDICTGDASVSVSGATADTTCSIDTADTTLTVNQGGKIDEGVLVTNTGAKITNSGTITNGVTSNTETAIWFQGQSLTVGLSNGGTIQASGADDAYGLYIDNDASAGISNSGKITASGEGGNGNSAYAIYVGGVTSGNISNSGIISGQQVNTSSGGSAYGIYLSDVMEGGAEQYRHHQCFPVQRELQRLCGRPLRER